MMYCSFERSYLDALPMCLYAIMLYTTLHALGYKHSATIACNFQCAWCKKGAAKVSKERGFASKIQDHEQVD